MGIKIETLPVEKLFKCSWNYKENSDFLREKLRNNMKRNGQLETILVRELGDGYEVVNGNHRLDVFNDLELKEVLCINLGKVEDVEAKRMAIELNETRFDSDTEKLSDLLQELAKSYNLGDLQDTMPFSEEELNSYLEILDFTMEEVKSELENMPDEEEEIKERKFKIDFTAEQYNVVLQAVGRVKEENQNDMLPVSVCIEYVCADYLGGASRKE